MYRQPLENIRPADMCIEVARGMASCPEARATPARRDFHQVDIGPKLNALGIGEARLAEDVLPAAGGSRVVGGIPFRIPESDEGFDNADLRREVLADYRHKLPGLDPAEFPNPIPDIRSRGRLPAARILSVDQPRERQDGKRGVFRFETPEGAVAFDIYVAPRSDGRGALLLGKNLKEPGTVVAGFLPDQDFHAFMVYRNAKGEASLPSDPFKFRLQNIWAQSC